MKGFFSKQDTQSTSRPDGKVYSCASCGMYRFVSTPRMEPYGKYKRPIMVIGEAPGETDDRRGKPWQGQSGKALQKAYRKHGVDLFQDCISTNAVFCRTIDEKGGNRTPSYQEVCNCRSRLLKIVKQYKPNVIILHGGTPVSSLIGYRWKNDMGGLMKWRGWTIPDREFNAWICPTFHPSYIERQQGFDEVSTIWHQDLKRAIALVDTPLPVYPQEEECVMIGAKALPVLELVYKELEARISAGEPAWLAFDLETTGLKPYNTEVHRIACISFYTGADNAYVCPPPESAQELALFRKLMTDERVGKVAANMKFEDTWLKVIYDIEVTPWVWDTMLAAHVLDNRPGICGLKFQSYVNFGLMGYEDEVKPYLRSDDSNTPNRIMKGMADASVRRKIMTYCGIDSLMTYQLARKQSKEMI